MSCKVLVADDDEGYRWPLVKMLLDAGFEVLEASDMDEAIRCGRKADIWVVDVRLPTGRYEGILAVEQLAQEDIRSAYPVFFISVLPETMAGEKLRFLKERSIHYEWLEKPFEPEFLHKRIRDCLTERGQ